MSKSKASAIALSLFLASPQLAAADLVDETEINDRILKVAVADKIRRSCGNISGKLFKARKYITITKEMANARGYSDAQINAYIENKIEKYKMRQRRDEYFTANGADRDNSASLCALGKQEIAQQSEIGGLLRTN